MKSELIFLDTYVLQRDMRVRLPKSVVTNLNIIRGLTKFDIYLNTVTKEIVLRINQNSERAV